MRLPSCLFTMVAIVDDTYTTIDMVADGSSGRCGITAHILIILINRSITIIQQVGAKIFNMLVVVLAIMSATAFRGTDTQSILAPCSGSGKVTFVVDCTGDLGFHLTRAAGRETANENIIVNVVTHNLSVSVVTQTAVGRAAT